MAKTVELKNFDLQKCKLISKNGIYIEYFDLTQKNDLVTIESDSVPHDDLIASLSRFKEVLAKSLGLVSGWDFARENNRKNEEALKLAVVGYNDEVERCNVTGVTMVGQNDLEGIKISGSLACDLGTVGLASPTIKFSEEEIGLGELSRSIVAELKNEVYLFIFKGKRATDLFTDVAEDESGLNNSGKVLKAV
jgi:hypothetical protein